MLESELRELLGRGADRSLATLETDIWAAVAARARAERVFRAVLAVQVVVLVVAMLGSGMVGHQSAVEQHPSGDLDIFSSQPSLAVSTLLLGPHP